jgi:hypothetical protein
VQDALIALLFNANIQACVVRYGMPYGSPHAKGFLKDYIRAIKEAGPQRIVTRLTWARSGQDHALVPPRGGPILRYRHAGERI